MPKRLLDNFDLETDADTEAQDKAQDEGITDETTTLVTSKRLEEGLRPSDLEHPILNKAP